MAGKFEVYTDERCRSRVGSVLFHRCLLAGNVMHRTGFGYGLAPVTR